MLVHSAGRASLAWITVFTAAAFLTASVQAGQDQMADIPKATVIKVHSDNCGSCKVIEPTLVELRKEFKGKPVQFVVFDLTTDETKSATAKEAEKLGLTHMLELYKKTGQVLVISTKDMKKAEVLKKTNTIEEYRAAIETAMS